MKKTLLLSILAFGSLTLSAQKLEKLWETDSIYAIPESVLPVPGENLMYMSLIDGGAWDADGKGGIALVDRTGRPIRMDWVTGLDAPKGLGFFGNRLYAADISSVVVIDRKNGKLIKKIEIDSAKGLNDITIDSKGVVYVSDSRTAKVWKIVNDKPTLFLENMKGVNGLKAIGQELFVSSGKAFLKADAAGKITPAAELPQGGDGVEPLGNGDFIVTAWGGYIFYVHANGTVNTLLETYQQKVNTADIGYDPKTQTLYVPTFNAKKLIAFRVNY